MHIIHGKLDEYYSFFVYTKYFNQIISYDWKCVFSVLLNMFSNYSFSVHSVIRMQLKGNMVVYSEVWNMFFLTLADKLKKCLCFAIVSLSVYVLIHVNNLQIA